jgi:hypothetical protein
LLLFTSIHTIFPRIIIELVTCSVLGPPACAKIKPAHARTPTNALRRFIYNPSARGLKKSVPLHYTLSAIIKSNNYAKAEKIALGYACIFPPNFLFLKASLKCGRLLNSHFYFKQELLLWQN